MELLQPLNGTSCRQVALPVIDNSSVRKSTDPAATRNSSRWERLRSPACRRRPLQRSLSRRPLPLAAVVTAIDSGCWQPHQAAAQLRPFLQQLPRKLQAERPHGNQGRRQQTQPAETPEAATAAGAEQTTVCCLLLQTASTCQIEGRAQHRLRVTGTMRTRVVTRVPAVPPQRCKSRRPAQNSPRLWCCVAAPPNPGLAPLRRRCRL